MPLEILVPIFEEGAYEAIAELLVLLDNGRVSVPDERSILDALAQRLQRLSTSENPEVSEAAAHVRERLDA